MSRDEDHQETHQYHQVEVIQVTGLFQEEDIGEAQEKEDRGHPVKQTQGDQDRQDAEQVEMKEHPVVRPGLDPLEKIVSEIELGGNEVSLNPPVTEVAVDFPKHDDPEGNSEESEAGDIPRREELVRQPGSQSGKGHGRSSPGPRCEARENAPK